MGGPKFSSNVIKTEDKSLTLIAEMSKTHVATTFIGSHTCTCMNSPTVSFDFQ